MARAHEPLANRDLAAYALQRPPADPAGLDHAYAALLEALARLLEAVADPHCARLLAPLVPGATMPRGARVPGTSYELDPVAAAFAIGVAAGWEGAAAVPGVAVVPGAAGAASLGALFALLDHRARRAQDSAQPPPRVAELLDALERAWRIQQVIEQEPGYAETARGAPLAVRVASAAVAARLLGGGLPQVAAAATLAFQDGGAPAPHPRAAGEASRARWAGADASSRGLRLALLALAADADADADAQRAAGAGPAPAGVADAGAVDPCVAAFAAAAARAQGRADPACALERFAAVLEPRFGARRAAAIRVRLVDRAALATLPVHDFAALLVGNA